MKDVTIHLGSTMMSSSHINKLGRAPVMQQCPQHLDHIQSAVEEYVLDDRNFRSFHLVNVPFEKNPHRTMNRHRHVRRSAELRTVSIIETLSELVAHTDACHYCGRHDDCDGRCLDMQKSSVAGCQKPAKKVHHHRRCDHTEFCKKSLHRFSEVDEATLEPSSGTSDMTQKATCTCQNSSKSFVVCDDTNLIRRHNYSKPVDRTANVGRKRQQKKVIAECVLPQCSSCLEHDTETRDNSNPLKYSNATWSSSDMDCYKIRSKCSSNINLKNELAISSSFPAPSKTAAVESEATSLPTVNSGRTLPSKMHCNFGNGRIEVAKMKANNTKKRSSSLLCNEYGNGVGVDNTTKYCSHVVHDPSHFMLSTLKSKGRTPDWIAGIFSIARRGNLDSLVTITFFQQECDVFYSLAMFKGSR